MSMRLSAAAVRPTSPPVRNRTVENIPRDVAAVVQYALSQVPRAGSPVGSRRSEQNRSNISALHTQDMLGKTIHARHSPAIASGQQSPRLSSGQQSPAPGNVNVIRVKSSGQPTMVQRERSPSPRSAFSPRAPVSALQFKVEQRAPHENLPNQRNPSAIAALQNELKELKRILEKQYEQQQIGTFGKMHASPDDAERVKKQVQLVQKVATVAPENKVRELCVAVACQQAEQEIFLRMMSTNMDALQQQVQALSQPKCPRLTHSTETLQQDSHTDDDAPSERSKSELKRTESQDRLDVIKSLLDAEMQASFADFCVSAMQESLGEELRKQGDAIKSLKLQMDCLNQLTRQSLSGPQQSDAIKSLKVQVDYLNDVTSQSLTALQALIKQVVLGMNMEEPNQDSELPRKLHTIVETACEPPPEMEVSGTEIASLVKAMYQDIVSQSAAPSVGSSDGVDHSVESVDRLIDASSAASTSDVYPAGCEAKDVEHESTAAQNQ